MRKIAYKNANGGVSIVQAGESTATLAMGEGLFKRMGKDDLTGQEKEAFIEGLLTAEINKRLEMMLEKNPEASSEEINLLKQTCADCLKPFYQAKYEGGRTEEQWLRLVARKTLFESQEDTDTPFVLVGEENMPDEPDRYFRDAFDLNDRDIEVDLTKAKEIHMATIRRVRDVFLKKADETERRAMTAFVAGDTKPMEAVQAEKQLLRDIPQRFDLSDAQSARELRQIWPVEIEQRETQR